MIEQWYRENGAGGIGSQEEAQQFVDAVNAGERYNASIPYDDTSRIAALEAEARNRGLRAEGSGGVGQSVDAFGRGAADIPTFGFADEVAALGDTVTRGGTYQDNLDFQRYVDVRDSQNNPYARFGGQLAGGFALPFGRFGGGVRGMAAEGAAYGGAYGVGSANGDIGDRLVGGATGAAVGGALGGAIGGTIDAIAPSARAFMESRRAAAANRAANEIDAPNATPAQVFDSADQLYDRTGVRVTPSPADVGGPIMARFAAGREQTLGGVGPMQAAANRTVGGAQRAAEYVASGLGNTARSLEQMGSAALQGAEKAISRLRTVSNTNYESAKRLAGDATVEATQGIQSLRSAIAEIADTGMGAQGLAILRSMEARLSQGPVSVQTLRNMRTALRDDLTTTNLRGSRVESLANDVLSAVGRDIDDGLRAQGLGDAADVFQRADGAYAQFMDLMDSAIEPIIGRAGDRSPEQVAQRLNSGLRGDSANTLRFIATLPAEEQGMVRATIASRLGRASDGQQNAASDAFSLSSFLTNYNQLTPEVRRAVFGRDGAAAMDNIAVIADGGRQAQRYRNNSQTTGAANASPGWSVFDIATFGGKVLADNISARMITSEPFLRWMAAGARKPNRQAQLAHIGRLGGLARTQPLIANDILGLQARLLEYAGQSRVAASTDGEQDPNNAR